MNKVLSPYQHMLSHENFRRLASYIEKNVGIKMPEQKILMMQARLSSRLNALNINSFDDYVDYVLSGSDNDEVLNMIDVMTTNLTHFFREPAHFDYLSEKVLPEFFSKKRMNIKIWSAGCSTGQEPYTLAIVFNEFLRNNKIDKFTFSIMASDISTRVLAKAEKAVYPAESVDKLPLNIKKRYFLKSKNSKKPLVRIKPELRNCVSFKRINFIDADYDIREKFQIIFCRNVLIYFDKETQKKVLTSIISHLEVGGYLFLGHSETVMNMNLPIKTVSPTVFKKIQPE